jgi:hypothetical protein
MISLEEAKEYVCGLNDHAEEQSNRGVESAHGWDEDSFVAGVQWALNLVEERTEYEYAMMTPNGKVYVPLLQEDHVEGSVLVRRPAPCEWKMID